MLQSWSEICPILCDAYQYKERFMDIWEATDRQKADSHYEDWVCRLPTELRPHFKEITTAFKNWRNEIFNYWDHRITNAFTESLNGK